MPGGGFDPKGQRNQLWSGPDNEGNEVQLVYTRDRPPGFVALTIASVQKCQVELNCCNDDMAKHSSSHK